MFSADVIIDTGPYRLLSYDLIQVQIQQRHLDESTLRAHLDTQSRHMRDTLDARLGTPIRKGYVVVDASCALVAPPSVRKLQADWMRRERRSTCVSCRKK